MVSMQQASRSSCWETKTNCCRWQCQQRQQFSGVKLGILVAYVAEYIVLVSIWQCLLPDPERLRY